MKASYSNIILICSILIITLLINLNLFSVPFIFDDYDFLFTWEKIRDFNNLPSLLLGDTPLGHEGVYRPLRSIFYALSLRFFGHNLFFYHIQELSIYFLCIIFVYLITQKMFKKQSLSFFTALFYAILPIHIDNVANLTGSFDTIGAVFFFLSFYLFQHYIDAPKKHQKLFLSISLAASFAAYATYEITLALPLLIFLYAYYQRKKISPRIYIAFLLCAVSFLSIRITFLQITTRGSLLENLPHKIVNTTNSFASYLLMNLLPEKAVLPTISSAFSSLEFSQAKEQLPQTNNILIPSFLLALLLLITTISVGIKNLLKREISGFGFIWFYLALLPAVAISLQSASFSNEYTQPLWPRYAIIASHGICLILANWLLALIRLQSKSLVMQYLKISGIFAVISMTTLNIIIGSNNLKNWRGIQPELLNQIRQLDKDEEKHNDLGVVYALEKKFDNSLAEFQIALQINPRYTKARQNLQKLCQIIQKIPKTGSKTQTYCRNADKIKS